MIADFFGPSEMQLMGVYHAPRSTASDSIGTRPKCVVICAPLGQEYIRTHWAIRLLARQLSRRGIHVLRFDMRGHGDSFGNPHEVDSLSQWRADLHCAVDQLKNRSDASNVMLVGLRTGAGIAIDVASERDDVHSLVAWEPVLHGQSYLEELREVHQLMLDLWFVKKTTPCNLQQEEILGYRYSACLIKEIETWRPKMTNLAVPHFVLQREAAEAANELQKVSLIDESVFDDIATWNHLNALEVAWLRPKTTQFVVSTVVDMFNRLKRIGVLESNDGEGSSTHTKIETQFAEALS